MRKQDPKTGRILPLIAMDEIPKIESTVVSMYKSGKSTRQIAGHLMMTYDCNHNMANNLVRSSLLTLGKN
jgi:hypothetical protein